MPKSNIGSRNSLGVTFTDLDPDKRYFPSVSRDSAGSFIALQPDLVSPLNEDGTYDPAPEPEVEDVIRE